MFRRHTNSSLEYGSWLKSPIYVFDPVDLGQPDMLANDARLTLMEWDAEVSLTPLQIQEIGDLKDKENLIAEGYSQHQYDAHPFSFAPNNDGSECAIEYDWLGPNRNDFAPGNHNYALIVAAEQLENEEKMPFVDNDAAWVRNKFFQFKSAPTVQTPTNEIIEPTTVVSVQHIIRGMIWARVDMTNGTILGNVGNCLYYVPRSYGYTHIGNNQEYINPWSALTTAVDGQGAVTGYTVDQNTIKQFVGRIAGGGQCKI